MEIFLDFWTARERPETDVDCYVGIYALSSILVSRRPEMGMEFGSKKMKPRLDEWAAHGQPTAGFRDC